MDTTTSAPLSVDQAAAVAGVSTKTIRRWLTSHRLEASRNPDGAWSIDPEALDRARSAPGQSQDSPTLHTGHGQVQSIVQELIATIERQAGELATLRIERDQLAAQLAALPAPVTSTVPEIDPQRDSEHDAVEPTQTSSETPQARPWWAFWR
jgi:hypothetical protein